METIELRQKLTNIEVILQRIDLKIGDILAIAEDLMDTEDGAEDDDPREKVRIRES